MENRKKKKRLSIKPVYTERRKFSLQVGSNNSNQHALSKLSHQLYQLKCQHFLVVVAILDDLLSVTILHYICISIAIALNETSILVALHFTMQNIYQSYDSYCCLIAEKIFRRPCRGAEQRQRQSVTFFVY